MGLFLNISRINVNTRLQFETERQREHFSLPYAETNLESGPRFAEVGLIMLHAFVYKSLLVVSYFSKVKRARNKLAPPFPQRREGKNSSGRKAT